MRGLRTEKLSRVVHLVFNRVGGVFEANDLAHLQLDIAVDEIVVEYTAGLEELAVLVETGERVAQRAADRRDLLEFGRRQVVEVLVHGSAGILLCLYPV